MSKSEPADSDAKPKKKGGMMKLIVIGVAGLVLIGGGIGAGLYAASSGMVGGGEHHVDHGPKLIPKSEQVRVAAGGGEGGGHGEGGGGTVAEGPLGEGGDKYASTYYAMDKEFTSNLRDSAHFIQVGIAMSTPYDERVISNVKTHEIAVRSAILLALGDATEEQVITNQGKQQLAQRLTKAINDTLKQKEGFGGIGNVYFTSFVVQ